ncbi:MAG: hypothetical protein ABIG61_14550 [Planctomycetota bacterium]
MADDSVGPAGQDVGFSRCLGGVDSIINIHKLDEFGGVILQHAGQFKYLISFNQLKYNFSADVAFEERLVCSCHRTDQILLHL